jgi:archaellum component FlaC
LLFERNVSANLVISIKDALLSLGFRKNTSVEAPPFFPMKVRYFLFLVIFQFLPASVHSAETAESAAKVTFVDDVLPILENRCTNCHNPDESKGGLDLSTYAATLTGGSGGEVVIPEDDTGSRLFSLTAHLEEPVMPPRGTKATEKELKILSEWIKGGILETSSSTARKSDKPKVDFDAITSGGKPDGPPAMPEHLLLEPAMLTERPNSIPALAHSPWAPVLAVAGQKQVLLYHSEDFDLLGVLPYPEGFPQDLSFSPNGAYLSCGGGRAGKSGNVVAWDVKTGERIIEVGKEYDCVLGADVSPDLKRAVMGGPGRNIKIWDTVAGEQIASIKKHTDWMLSAAYSPDGVIFATGGRGGDLYTWEAATGYEFFTLKGHTKGVTGLSWRPDGNVLASCSEDGQIILWEMNEGSQVKKWNAHPGGALSVAFAPNGNLVSVGRDKTLKVWQGDGKEVKSIEASSDVVLSVAISHDSSRAFSGDIFGNVEVWDVDSGQKLASIVPNPPAIEGQLAYAEQQVSELKDQLPELKADVETASKELATARTELEHIDKKTDQAKEVLKSNQETFAELQQTIKALTAQLTEKQATANAKDAIVAKTMAALAQANGKLKSSQEKAETLKAAMIASTTALEAAADAQHAAKVAAAKSTLPADQKQKHDQLAALFFQANKLREDAKTDFDAKTRVSLKLAANLSEAKKVAAVSAEQLEKRQTSLASAEIQLTDAMNSRHEAANAVKSGSKDGKPAPDGLIRAQTIAIELEQQARAAAETSRKAVATADATHQQSEADRKRIESQLAPAKATQKQAQASYEAAQKNHSMADTAFKPFREASARAQVDQKNLAAKTAAHETANNAYQDIKGQSEAADKAAADIAVTIDQHKATLIKAQEEAKAATESLGAKRGEFDLANKQLATQQETIKEAEVIVANATKAKETLQARVADLTKKEADSKKSIEFAQAKLESFLFLAKKWEAAAINLTAHEQSEELEDMTTELVELKEEETEAQAEVAQATQSREAAEQTLAEAKKTIVDGNQQLQEKSTTVLEHALELVSSRAMTELKEVVAAETASMTASVSESTNFGAGKDSLDAAAERIEAVAAETLAYKTLHELDTEVETLRDRLSELKSFLQTSYTKADETKSAVNAAAKVASETPQVIAERKKSEKEAARELAKAEADRTHQERQLSEQQKLIGDLRAKYLAALPERN